ncbi:MAG: tetratricopeptide repeat protein [Bacteroidetes bacterium]|nr:tetratricopeptide repeat protein [Bacteroidota bacterium]
MKSRLILLFLTGCISISVHGQKKDSLLNLLGKAGERAKIGLLIDLADEFFDLSPDTALIYAAEALKLAEKYDSTRKVAISSVLSGNIREKLNESDKALPFYIKALDCYEKLGDTHQIALACNRIGVFYYSRLQAEKAITYYQKAIEVNKEARNETDNSIYFNNIGMAYCDMSQYDTAIYYYEKSLELADKLEREDIRSSALSSIGEVYHAWGLHRKAVEYLEKSLVIEKRLGDNEQIFTLYNDLGIILKQSGEYTEALKYYEKAKKIAEKSGNKGGIAVCLNNMATLYSAWKKYDLALEFYRQILSYDEQSGNKSNIAAGYNNIGLNYKETGDYQKALEYLDKALSIQQELNRRSSVSITLNNIGSVYHEMKEYDKAVNFYKESYKLAEESGEKEKAANRLNNIGCLYHDMGRYLTALEYFDRSMVIAQEIASKPLIMDNHKTIAETGLQLKDFKTAYSNFRKYIQIKDSIFTERSMEAINRLEAEYETEKKEKEIILLNKDKQLKEAELITHGEEIRKQRYIIFTVILCFVLAGLFSMLIYRLYRQKRRLNIVLIQQNEDIKQQKEEIISQRDEIEAQRDEIEAQRDMVAGQRDTISMQKKELTDSIIYAKRIQEAVLPDISNLTGFGYFVIFKPKDVVSGDFYWATAVNIHGSRYTQPCVSTAMNTILVVAVADCTGHGVPGAFMSMLGISFLNEIVRRKEVTKASQVLDRLRESVIIALRQRDDEGDLSPHDSIKHSIDIALCAIRTDTLECQYAGANNPLWIVHNNGNPVDTHSCVYQQNNVNQTNNPDSPLQLTGIMPDRQPIGIYPDMKPFTNHVLQLQKGDVLYLFSDGFTNQFGGTQNKRYRSMPFRELLLKIAGLSPEDQRERLHTEFDSWKGSNDQADDVTILGLKI